MWFVKQSKCDFLSIFKMYFKDTSDKLKIIILMFVVAVYPKLKIGDKLIIHTI